MDSKISVIIPIYNVEEYLERCVESVVNQTYKNLEILLIDDGSPDKCYKICDDWAKKDKRIKVVHKENGGLSDARNVGIRYSTGKYLCFIDSDDCIDENYIQYMYQAIKDNCSDIAICKFRKFSDVKTLETIQDDPNVQILDNRSLIFKLFESDNIHFISACTKLYDKNIFYDLEFDIGKLHEDEYIVHKIFAKCKTAVYVPLPLYNYYERIGNVY